MQITWSRWKTWAYCLWESRCSWFAWAHSSTGKWRMQTLWPRNRAAGGGGLSDNGSRASNVGGATPGDSVHRGSSKGTHRDGGGGWIDPNQAEHVAEAP